jgi:acetyl-CoA carboxylase / biotin carboxylase 1
LHILNNILDGFDNQAIMNATLKELLEVLRMPELPYSDISAILATLSGRMNAKLEEQIRSILDKAKPAGQDFPAVRIKKLIDTYLSELKPQERTMARTAMASLIDVVERFKHGLKVHEWNTIASLLARYEETEKLFGGDIEQRVLKLRDQHKDNLDTVAQLVLSHIKAPSKNKLVLSLLDLIKEGGSAALTQETKLAEVLNNLATLDSRYDVISTDMPNTHSGLDPRILYPSRLVRSSFFAKCHRMMSALSKWRLFFDKQPAQLHMVNSRVTESKS